MATHVGRKMDFFETLISEPGGASHSAFLFLADTPAPTPLHQKYPCDNLRSSKDGASAAIGNRVLLETALPGSQRYRILSLRNRQRTSSLPAQPRRPAP